MTQNETVRQRDQARAGTEICTGFVYQKRSHSSGTDGICVAPGLRGQPWNNPKLRFADYTLTTEFLRSYWILRFKPATARSGRLHLIPCHANVTTHNMYVKNAKRGGQPILTPGP